MPARPAGLCGRAKNPAKLVRTLFRISHIVPSLESRHGGPSKSVRALANAQAASGAAVTLYATQEPGYALLPPAPIETARLRIFPRVTPRWLCRSPELAQAVRDEPADAVHAHSLWLLTLRYAHQGARHHASPLVISPRGMMSGWAYQHRRWRKALASALVHPGAMKHAAGWHATSAEEAEDIRRLGFRQPVCIAPNGVDLPEPTQLVQSRAYWEQRCPAVVGRRVALFYSRLHRKKRLRELLDLWCTTAPRDWLLLIVGVPEEYTVTEIENWIKIADATERIAVFDGTNAPTPYAVASLFLLPSHSENFGLVIAEALAAGLPALVTDTTPWTQLATQEAGWCVPWSDYAEALRQALGEAPETLTRRGDAGRLWMQRDFTWLRSGERLLEFYRHLRHG